ncbi:MAG: arylsulfatase [Verrucomicrobia bacterium]|nr:arylsulfatase [Verrucomicrobiota bacterium]
MKPIANIGVILGFIFASTWPLATQARLPNIVVLYADDLGYGDVQCYNPDRSKIPTPNIDRLAGGGMRFTDAHSSSGVCTPSRYTLLTGRYHWRTKLQSGIVGLWGKPLIAKDRLTIGSLAKKQGYQTACIGKWHLGWDWPITNDARKAMQQAYPKNALVTQELREVWKSVFNKPIDGGPITRGFDVYFGTDVPNWPPYCFIDQDQTLGVPSEFLDEKQLERNLASRQGPALKDWNLETILPSLKDRAVKFIANQAKTPKPFLLYLPFTSPHTPLSVSPAWKGKSGLGPYADLVMETDGVVGSILEALESNGLTQNTMVIFTSDNGCAHYIDVNQLEAKGHFPSGPLRGYKSDAWEGGHRVPFIVRWPNIVQANSENDALIHQADLLATFAQILEVELEANEGEDSFSLLPLLRGQTGNSPRATSVSCSIRGIPSVRQGPWKIILDAGSGGWTKGEVATHLQLYNLGNDIGETNNLAMTHPQQVHDMQSMFESLIVNGRSSPGPQQSNDVNVKRY